ncbi:hypothetical protein VTO42DRAFT_3011 [Malbranchea cinnamomea]
MFGAHRTSAPFTRMKELEAEHQTRSRKPRSFFISPCGGFLERDAVDCVPVSEQFFRITNMSCKPANRHVAVELLTRYARYLHEHQREVMSNMVALDTEVVSRFFLFERYPSEAVAKMIGFQGLGHFKMIQLKELGLEQTFKDYRAARGFLSKKEGLVCAPFTKLGGAKERPCLSMRRLIQFLKGRKLQNNMTLE